MSIDEVRESAQSFRPSLEKKVDADFDAEIAKESEMYCTQRELNLLKEFGAIPPGMLAFKEGATKAKELLSVKSEREAELEEKLGQAYSDFRKVNEENIELTIQISELLAEKSALEHPVVVQMKEALEYYADRKSYTWSHPENYSSNVQWEGGEKAIKALEAYRKARE